MVFGSFLSDQVTSSCPPSAGHSPHWASTCLAPNKNPWWQAARVTWIPGAKARQVLKEGGQARGCGLRVLLLGKYRKLNQYVQMNPNKKQILWLWSMKKLSGVLPPAHIWKTFKFGVKKVNIEIFQTGPGYSFSHFELQPGDASLGFLHSARRWDLKYQMCFCTTQQAQPYCLQIPGSMCHHYGRTVPLLAKVSLEQWYLRFFDMAFQSRVAGVSISLNIFVGWDLNLEWLFCWLGLGHQSFPKVLLGSK